MLAYKCYFLTLDNNFKGLLYVSKEFFKKDHEKPFCLIIVSAGQNTRHPWCYFV